MNNLKKLFLFLLVMGLSVYTIRRFDFIFPANNQVLAEDDDDGEEEDEDDEDEDEDEDEDDDEYSENTSQTTTETSEPVVQTQPTYVWITEFGYDRDTDRDGIVDALDPDSTKPQQMYFTDTDLDTVPDAIDKFPGIDDLSVVEETDLDSNGIVDYFQDY